MKDRVFLDTNLLIYLYSDDEANKSDIVSRLIDENECYISIQVLNEFSNVLIKKFKVPSESVLDAINELTNAINVSNLSIRNTLNALKIHKKFKLSYYDSLILSSALKENCIYLYTEDMHNGLKIDEKLEIKNPFL